MMLIRRFEEEAARNYAKGKIGGFLHLYIGQEAIAVAAAEALDDGDYIFQTYRDHGIALARGMYRGGDVLILDDVFSELDADRGDALLDQLPTGQALLTSAAGLPPKAHPDRVWTITDHNLSEVTDEW